MTKRITLFFVVTIVFVRCTTNEYKNQSAKLHSVKKIRFCDLPKYEGQLVKTDFSYSRAQEYSSIHKKENDCDSALFLSFDFLDRESVPRKLNELLKKANYSNYKYHLNMTAVGSFKKGRYGHLGSNNGLFIITEIIEATLIKN
jgi:hypothetical protein